MINLVWFGIFSQNKDSFKAHLYLETFATFLSAKNASKHCQNIAFLGSLGSKEQIALSLSIVVTTKVLDHRYLKNTACLSFVVCPLLAAHLPRHFPFFCCSH